MNVPFYQWLCLSITYQQSASPVSLLNMEPQRWSQVPSPPFCVPEQDIDPLGPSWPYFSFLVSTVSKTLFCTALFFSTPLFSVKIFSKHSMQNFCLFAGCFSASHAGISPLTCLSSSRPVLFSPLLFLQHPFFFFKSGLLFFKKLFSPGFVHHISSCVIMILFITCFSLMIWSHSFISPSSVFLEYSCLSVYFLASFYPYYQTEELT